MASVELVSGISSQGSSKATEMRPSGGSALPKQRDERENKHGESWGRFLSYFIHDSSPGTNKTALAREPIDPDRYRVTLQDRTYFTEDIYSTVNINKLSDPRFLQDFDEPAFRQNPWKWLKLSLRWKRLSLSLTRFFRHSALNWT